MLSCIFLTSHLSEEPNNKGKITRAVQGFIQWRGRKKINKNNHKEDCIIQVRLHRYVPVTAVGGSERTSHYCDIDKLVS